MIRVKELRRVRGPVVKMYKQKLQNIQLEEGMTVQAFFDEMGVSDVGHRGASAQKAYAVVLTFDDVKHRDLLRYFLIQQKDWVVTDGSESPKKKDTTPSRPNHNDLTGGTGGIHTQFNIPTPSPQVRSTGYTTPTQNRYQTPKHNRHESNSDPKKRGYQSYSSASKNKVRYTTNDRLLQNTNSKNLIIITYFMTERLKEEQLIVKDQQYMNAREKTSRKPLCTHKPIPSWVKSLAHRDEVQMPGLIWAKCIKYIQKRREQQKDQILPYTCKSTNKLKTTKIMPLGITSTQKNKHDEQIKPKKPDVSIDTTLTPETTLTKEVNKTSKRTYSEQNKQITERRTINRKNGNTLNKYLEQMSGDKQTTRNKKLKQNKKKEKENKWANNINYGEIWDSTKGYPGEGPANIAIDTTFTNETNGIKEVNKIKQFRKGTYSEQNKNKNKIKEIKGAKLKRNNTEIKQITERRTSKTKIGNKQNKLYEQKREDKQIKKNKKVKHNNKTEKGNKLANNINYGDIWDSTKGYPGEGPAQTNGRMGKKKSPSKVRGDKKWQ